MLSATALCRRQCVHTYLASWLRTTALHRLIVERSEGLGRKHWPRTPGVTEQALGCARGPSAARVKQPSPPPPKRSPLAAAQKPAHRRRGSELRGSRGRRVGTEPRDLGTEPAQRHRDRQGRKAGRGWGRAPGSRGPAPGRGRAAAPQAGLGWAGPGRLPGPCRRWRSLRGARAGPAQEQPPAPGRAARRRRRRREGEAAGGPYRLAGRPRRAADPSPNSSRSRALATVAAGSRKAPAREAPPRGPAPAAPACAGAGGSPQSCRTADGSGAAAQGGSRHRRRGCGSPSPCGVWALPARECVPSRGGGARRGCFSSLLPRFGASAAGGLSSSPGLPSQKTVCWAQFLFLRYLNTLPPLVRNGSCWRARNTVAGAGVCCL